MDIALMKASMHGQLSSADSISYRTDFAKIEAISADSAMAIAKAVERLVEMDKAKLPSKLAYVVVSSPADKLTPEAKAEKMAELKKDFNIREDEVNHVTFFVHKNWKLEGIDKQQFACYTSTSQGDVILMSTYAGKDAINHTHVKITIDTATLLTEVIPVTSEQHRTAKEKNTVKEENKYANGLYLANKIAANIDKKISYQLLGDKGNGAEEVMTDNDKKAFKQTAELAALMKE